MASEPPTPPLSLTAFTMRRGPLALALAGALILHLLRARDHVLAVWSQGTWFDTDDAMRMVTVRAFLEGQGWFDLVAHRLGAEQPVVMHWSRVVDVPLALMIRAFGLVADGPLAETLTRLAFPALMLLVFILGLMRAAEAVAGPDARPVAFFLSVLGGAATPQFLPGRIDHHGPQIVLLTFALAALLESLQPLRARRAAVAGGLFALSLAISVENLAFILASTGVLGWIWVWQGDKAALPLRHYAVGLGAASLVLFVATVPPELRGVDVADAFGPGHLLGILAGAGLLVLCSLTRLAGVPGRLVAGLCAFAATLLLLRLIYPGVLGDPFAPLPPLMREMWLDQVGEAQPLWRMAQRVPTEALVHLGPPILVLAGLCWWCRRADRSEARNQALLLFALCAVGFVAALWMVRAASSLAAPLTVAAVAVAVRLAARMPERYRALAPVLMPLVIAVPASGTLWAAALPTPAEATTTGRSGAAGTASCTTPADLRGLAALPPMRLLTTIDAGPMILAQTPHAVLAGPYHRDIEGDMISLRTFGTPMAEAALAARTSPADHLAFCAAQGEVDALAKQVPEGLAAHLQRGEVPDWLTNRVIAGPWTIYEIR